MKPLKTITLLLSFAGACSAATMVQSQPYSFVPTDSAALTFNQFDTSLGTLTSITITTSVQKTGGSLFVDNQSMNPATGTITQSVTLTLQSPDVSLTSTLGQPIGSGITVTSSYLASVGADIDGVGNLPTYNPLDSDVDGTNFGPVSKTDSGSVTPLFFGGYEGTSTFVMNVNGVQSFDTQAIGGAAASITPASIAGEVTITYTYDAIPEPTSVMLGGLGLLALLRRRR